MQAGILRIAPEIVINAVGYANVDKAEQDQEKAFLINSNGVAHIAFALKNTKIPLIHFSTDYIFDGNKSQGYVESDSPNPLSIYGASKAAGEFEVMSTLANQAFTRMNGTAAISGGSARTDDFQVNSPVADVYARGAVDLAKMLPDMALTAKLPKGSIGGAVGELSNDAEGRPTFVFKMKGSWKPVFDSSQVQKKALEKAKEEIKTKAADIIQNEGKKLLEGLFKR